MKKLVAYRLLSAIPLLFFVGLATFMMIQLMPGSPAAAILGLRATPEGIEQLEQRLGLNEPLHDQFFTWLGNAVTGDLGESVFSSRPVTDLILQGLPATLSLTFASIIVALVLGIGAGLASALRPGSLIDRAVTGLTAAGLSVPPFWLGILLIGIFAVSLDWVPVIGWTPPERDLVGWARGLILPALALGVAASATIARQMRGSMLETLDAPFIQTLRATGTPRRTIVFRYGLKNAMAPVLTITGFQFITLIGGSFVIEQVFSIPGLGPTLLDAINRRDMPIVQGVTIVTAIAVVIVYLLIDVAYGLLNPRARPE